MLSNVSIVVPVLAWLDCDVSYQEGVLHVNGYGVRQRSIDWIKSRDPESISISINGIRALIPRLEAITFDGPGTAVDGCGDNLCYGGLRRDLGQSNSIQGSSGIKCLNGPGGKRIKYAIIGILVVTCNMSAGGY